VGFEPTTQGLKVPCSATELPARTRSVADAEVDAAADSSIDAWRSRRWRRNIIVGSDARGARYSEKPNCCRSDLFDRARSASARSVATISVRVAPSPVIAWYWA
jgi:hypothetical protein